MALAEHAVPELLLFADPEERRETQQLKRDTPALRARDQGKYQWLEGAIAGALAERTGTSPDGLRTRLVAVLVTGVLRVAQEGWTDSAATGVSATDHVQHVVEALKASLSTVPD